MSQKSREGESILKTSERMETIKMVQEDLTGFGHKVVLCRPRLEQGRSRVRFDEGSMSGGRGRKASLYL